MNYLRTELTRGNIEFAFASDCSLEEMVEAILAEFPCMSQIALRDMLANSKTQVGAGRIVLADITVNVFNNEKKPLTVVIESASQ